MSLKPDEKEAKKIDIDNMLQDHFSKIKMFKMGKIQTKNDDSNILKTYVVYACKLKSEAADVRVLIGVYENMDSISPDQIKYSSKWTSLHFRNYTEIGVLNEIIELDWEILKKTDHQEVDPKKLVEGIMIDEIDDLRQKNTRSYQQKGNSKHIFVIETKEQNTDGGNRLKKQYELDLVISSGTNLVIERL